MTPVFVPLIMMPSIHFLLSAKSGFIRLYRSNFLNRKGVLSDSRKSCDYICSVRNIVDPDRLSHPNKLLVPTLKHFFRAQNINRILPKISFTEVGNSHSGGTLLNFLQNVSRKSDLQRSYNPTRKMSSFVSTDVLWVRTMEQVKR